MRQPKTRVSVDQPLRVHSDHVRAVKSTAIYSPLHLITVGGHIGHDTVHVCTGEEVVGRGAGFSLHPTGMALRPRPRGTEFNSHRLPPTSHPIGSASFCWTDEKDFFYTKVYLAYRGLSGLCHVGTEGCSSGCGRTRHVAQHGACALWTCIGQYRVLRPIHHHTPMLKVPQAIRLQTSCSKARQREKKRR